MTLATKQHPSTTFLLESAFPAVGNAKNLKEQMAFVAAKLLDYGYLFPPMGPIESSEKDEILKYYSDSIRPELERLLSKFAQQEWHLIEQNVCVHCEYRNFRKYVEVTHLPELRPLFGRYQIEEMAKQLALLALRGQACEQPLMAGGPHLPTIHGGKTGGKSGLNGPPVRFR